MVEHINEELSIVLIHLNYLNDFFEATAHGGPYIDKDIFVQ